jgi:hypothetical protein
MLIEQFYREDLDGLRSDLDTVQAIVEAGKRSEWNDLLADPGAPDGLSQAVNEFSARISAEARRAKRILADVEMNLEAAGLRDFGLYLMATVQALRGELAGFEAALVMTQDALPESFGAQKAKIDRLLGWTRGKAAPVVDRISSGVSKLLVNLLSPSSWRVEGGIGAGFLGLRDGVLVIEF